VKKAADVNPEFTSLFSQKIIILKFVLQGGLQSLKNAKNFTSTRKQKQKHEITKERSIKSENNKKNHKNYKNRDP
jgi:hypothetical protein